eukprot:94595-Prorocentrum_minimum.AAC.9
MRIWEGGDRGREGVGELGYAMVCICFGKPTLTWRIWVKCGDEMRKIPPAKWCGMHAMDAT